MRRLGPLLPALLCGCAASRDAAPEDVDGALAWLFQRFEDEQSVAEGVQALGPWLDGEGRTEAAHAGIRLSQLDPEHVADVEQPAAADLSEALGVAAGCTSPHPMADHVSLLVLADQTYLDPQNYPRYEREILEGDPEGFTAGDGLLRTLNDIERRNVGVSIPFLQRKDYRWVETEAGTAVLARSWIPEGSCAEGGQNCVVQGYAIDLFWDDGARDVVRLTTSWSQVSTLLDGVLSEDQLVAVAVNGILEIYENTDRTLSDDP